MHQRTVTRIIALALIATAYLGSAQTTTVTVASSQPEVGSTSTYTFAISNQPDLTRVEFSFTNWTDTNTDPFSSSHTTHPLRPGP